MSARRVAKWWGLFQSGSRSPALRGYPAHPRHPCNAPAPCMPLKQQQAIPKPMAAKLNRHSRLRESSCRSLLFKWTRKKYQNPVESNTRSRPRRIACGRCSSSACFETKKTHHQSLKQTQAALEERLRELDRERVLGEQAAAARMAAAERAAADAEAARRSLQGQVDRLHTEAQQVCLPCARSGVLTREAARCAVLHGTACAQLPAWRFFVCLQRFSWRSASPPAPSVHVGTLAYIQHTLTPPQLTPPGARRCRPPLRTARSWTRCGHAARRWLPSTTRQPPR